jgi:hypothetical protein
MHKDLQQDLGGSRVASGLDSNQRKPLAGDSGCATGGLGFSKQG